MFNVKISLLYFLLIALSVAAILMIVDGQKEQAVERGKTQLQNLPKVFEVHKELRESRLEDFAHRLGTSDLRARLQALKDFRKRFIEVDRYICSGDTGVKCDLMNTVFSEERARIADETFGQTTFKEFGEVLKKEVKRYHPEWTAEDEMRFDQDTRKQLRECFGRGSTQCDWRFTHEALADVLPRLREETTVGAEGGGPELVLVFDSQGIGIASATNDAWSYRREYMDLVARLRQFVTGELHKGLTPVYYDVLKLQETGDVDYLVAMVPLVGAAEEFQGAILVGESITGKMVEAEKALFDAEVTYIMGDKPIVSTMERSAYQFLLTSAKVQSRLKKHLVSNDSWLAVSMPYYGLAARVTPAAGVAAVPTFVNGVAYGSRYQGLRVVLARSRGDWEGGYSLLETWTPVFGGLLFFVGLVLFWLLIRNHLQPFEAIDQGIHEVINGNFDYEFPFDYTEDLPSGMAQSLNLMNAVLLGKPLPEDEDEVPATWDGSQLSASPSGAGSARGELIIELDPVAGEVSSELLREPAESYYKRVYAEYRQARQDSGSPDESITYVRFVEQLVKGERDIKAHLGCKHVRFQVTRRDDTVVLSPVPIA